MACESSTNLLKYEQFVNIEQAFFATYNLTARRLEPIVFIMLPQSNNKSPAVYHVAIKCCGNVLKIVIFDLILKHIQWIPT
jgi:hypothetical protein